MVGLLSFLICPTSVCSCLRTFVLACSLPSDIPISGCFSHTRFSRDFPFWRRLPDYSLPTSLSPNPALVYYQAVGLGGTGLLPRLPCAFLWHTCLLSSYLALQNESRPSVSSTQAVPSIQWIVSKCLNQWLGIQLFPEATYWKLSHLPVALRVGGEIFGRWLTSVTKWDCWRHAGERGLCEPGFLLFLFASWLPGEASLFNEGFSLVTYLYCGLAILISLGFWELNGVG